MEVDEVVDELVDEVVDELVDEMVDEVVDEGAAKEKDLLDYDVTLYPHSQQSETFFEIIFLINLSSKNEKC